MTTLKSAIGRLNSSLKNRFEADPDAVNVVEAIKAVVESLARIEQRNIDIANDLVELRARQIRNHSRGSKRLKK